MRFGLPLPHTRQPQYSAPIDRGDPFGASLVGGLLPSIGTNPVTNAAVTTASNVTRVATLHGRATQHAATNGQVGIGASGGFSTIVPAGTNWTIFFRLQVTALGVRQIFVGDYDSGGANHSMQIEITAGNLWACEVYTAAGASVPVVGGAVTLGWHDVQLSYAVGTGICLIVDNGAPSVFSFSANLRAGVAFRIGTPGLANTVGFQGRIASCLIFSRDFRAQSGELSQNPWQVYKAPTRRLWEGAAGGPASYTLTCATGSYSLSGNSAGLTAAHRVTATQGVYALTGNPAALRAGHLLSAAPGSYSITGNPATLIPPGAKLVAAAGSYVITGQPAALKAGHRMTCASGSYVLAGSAVITPDDGTANEYSATIMRESIINSEVTALLDRIASQAGTMCDTLNSTTIMRANAVNSTGTMRADEINQTADLL